MEDFERELKAGFLDEALQLMDGCEQCFLELETRPDDAENIAKLFRLAHSLKGTSRAVGFDAIANLTHEMESLLTKLKEKVLTADAQVVGLLLKSNDRLRSMVETLRGNLDARVDAPDLVAELQARLRGPMTAPQPVAAPAVAPAPVAVSAPAVEAAAPAPESGPAQAASDENGSMGLVGKAPEKAAASVTDETIRVSLRRLEKLTNNVGELVILQTVLNQHRSEILSPLLQRTIGQLAKITKEIQDISMSLRMVPLKQTFQKMQRVVRDTAQELGKDIKLLVEGEDTDVDKTVLEHLTDPLVHLVRNAVDHGFEKSEDRVKAGKPAVGSLWLEASHRGEQLVIEVWDDGRGIDASVIIRKAKEKNIIPPTANPSDEEAYALLFHPGFSTRSEVTAISGRGVGLDVVKSNVENLGGRIQLETEVGKGSCFRILLPLTLGIIEGMVVRIGNERYIIPMAHVHESVEPEPGQLHFVTGIGDVFHLRGETLPLFRLNRVLRRQTPEKKAEESILIVHRTQDRAFCVLVDEILAQQQVVIKQLGSEIKNRSGISGSAILGDGRPALILDIRDLVIKDASAARRATSAIMGVG